MRYTTQQLNDQRVHTEILERDWAHKLERYRNGLAPLQYVRAAFEIYMNAETKYMEMQQHNKGAAS